MSNCSRGECNPWQRCSVVFLYSSQMVPISWKRFNNGCACHGGVARRLDAKSPGCILNCRRLTPPERSPGMVRVVLMDSLCTRRLPGTSGLGLSALAAFPEQFLNGPPCIRRAQPSLSLVIAGVELHRPNLKSSPSIGALADRART
jgi:hypothetical protein